MSLKSALPVLLSLVLGLVSGCAPKRPTPPPAPPSPSAMQLTSTAFKPNDFIPPRYTCDGDNVSPPLVLSGVPVTAASLALLVDDPDAPGGDWVHWLVFNLSPETLAIPEASVPPGAVVGLNDFGQNSWGGPCPPSGIHRYQFTVYALDTDLELPPTATKAAFLNAVKTHQLATAQLLGLYKRQ